MPILAESTRSKVRLPQGRLLKAWRPAVREDVIVSISDVKSAILDGRTALALIVLGITTMFFGAGCATIQGERYTYLTLPNKYVASAVNNPQTIDLSKLASTTSSSELIDQGDVLEVTISAGLNEKDTVKLLIRVAEDGYADVPEVGHLKLAGLEMTQAEAVIGAESVRLGIYQKPSVTVMMKQQRMNHITVSGAVKKPRIYELPRGRSDLLSALSAAEGLDASASSEVVIHNPGGGSESQRAAIAARQRNPITSAGHTIEIGEDSSETIKVDLVSATKDQTGGYQLNDGAVVHVQKRDPEPIYVLGLVVRPGRFDYPVGRELRVTDAVAMAWGVSSIGANKIFVIRHKPADEIDGSSDPQNPDKVRSIVIQVSLANAKQKAEANVRLQPGDVVSVEQTPLTFLMMMMTRVGMGFGTTVPLTGTPLL